MGTPPRRAAARAARPTRVRRRQASSPTGRADPTARVLACPLSGCSGTPTTLASAQFGAQGIALGANRVYWTNHDGDEVRSCATGGCGRSPTLFASGEDAPTGIATDAANVYWTDYGSDQADGRVRVQPQR